MPTIEESGHIFAISSRTNNGAIDKLFFARNKITADRIAGQSGELSVTPIDSHLIDGKWFVVATLPIEEMSEADEHTERQEKMKSEAKEKADKALKKARDLGLSDDDIVYLQNAQIDRSEPVDDAIP